MESSIFNISHYLPHLPGILLSHQQALAFLYLPHQDHGDGDSQLHKETVGKSAIFLILCWKQTSRQMCLHQKGSPMAEQDVETLLRVGSPLVKALPCRPTRVSERVTGCWGWVRQGRVGTAEWLQDKPPSLSSPGCFQFRSLPAGQPQADKTCHLKRVLESSKNGWSLLGMNFGLGGHLGVKWRDLFYGLRKEEEKNSLSTAQPSLWGMKRHWVFA